MGVCKRKSEIASLLGPNNIFSSPPPPPHFCNMLDYNNLKTSKILHLSRLPQQESSNRFPCYSKAHFFEYTEC